MKVLPDKLNQALDGEIYIREDKTAVKDALARLEVKVSQTFIEFYNRYAGPFWEEYVPFELLDLVDEENNIVAYTFICRKEYGFPKQYLILSEISANAVLVLDTLIDNVYIVNFEGGDELLLKGELEATWPTFSDFLKSYFNC
ncbi:SMI1/KNR4 family protein [Priestia megaterium]|uniref:SMI1/KNR4 family protein n=1 Tax=Priestia megaterium TaxID=1404 RepID=UPI0022B871EC|nr:SMI1/KNR4 family protein [Priestia megaterium]MCZ8496733.1 SMI1/KNR4 family protein [Priestia megaterium]